MNVIAERFYDELQDEGHACFIGYGKNGEFIDDDLLAAQSDCANGCYTRAHPADVKAGHLPCPNGHASVAWS